MKVFSLLPCWWFRGYLQRCWDLCCCSGTKHTLIKRQNTFFFVLFLPSKEATFFFFFQLFWMYYLAALTTTNQIPFTFSFTQTLLNKTRTGDQNSTLFGSINKICIKNYSSGNIMWFVIMCRCLLCIKVRAVWSLIKRLQWCRSRQSGLKTSVGAAD